MIEFRIDLVIECDFCLNDAEWRDTARLIYQNIGSQNLLKLRLTPIFSDGSLSTSVTKLVTALAEGLTWELDLIECRPQRGFP